MRLLALVSILSLLVISAGCKRTVYVPPTPKTVTILFITNQAADEVKLGAESVAKPDGRVTLQFKDGGTEAEQLAALKQVGTVDAVAIDCLPTPQVSAALSELAAKGVAIITYNGDCQITGRKSHVGATPFNVGRTLAFEAVDPLGQNQRGVVALISGEETADNQAIEAGVKSYIAAIPTMSLKGPVRTAAKPDDVIKAVNAVMAEEPNIAAWIIMNPAATPDVNAAPIAKLTAGTVVVYASGDKAIDAAKALRFAALVVPPFMQYGQAVVQMAVGMARDFENYPELVSFGPDVAKNGLTAEIEKSRAAIRKGEIITVAVPTGGPALPAAAGATPAPAPAPVTETPAPAAVTPAPETPAPAAPAATAEAAPAAPAATTEAAPAATTEAKPAEPAAAPAATGEAAPAATAEAATAATAEAAPAK